MQTLKIEKKKSEHRKMIRESYYFNQFKTKLRGVFDYINRTGTPNISTNEIRTALHLLNVPLIFQNIEDLEAVLNIPKDPFMKENITFDDFVNLYFNLLEFTDLQQNFNNFPLIDFIDPENFVITSHNRIITKNFSSKVLDESVVLKKRVERKYTLNIQHNSKILKNIEDEIMLTYPNSPHLQSFLNYSYSLRDCWTWLEMCFESKRSPYDFTNGLRNVLSNLADNASISSHHSEKIVMTHYIVYANYERQEALNLLGWSYIDYFPKTSNPKLNENIKNFEKEENYSRAAAICVFHFDFARAFQCLANVQTENNEISFLRSILQLLKDWQINLYQDRDMQGAMVFESSRYHDECDESYNAAQDFSNEIFQHRNKPQRYENLKKDLKFIKTLCEHLNPSDPYFRAICKFISYSEPLSQIIRDQNLKFIDRIAFAYRFLGPKSLLNYQRETIDEAREKGYLGALLLVGKSHEGLDIIQSYLDNTGDIQSVALLGVFFRIFKFPNEDFYKNILSNYKDMLNRFSYWEHRILLEKEIIEIEKQYIDFVKDRRSTEMVDKHDISINNLLPFRIPSLAHSFSSNQGNKMKSSTVDFKYEKLRKSSYSEDTKPIPNCVICLLPVTALNPYIELQEKIKRVTAKSENTIIDPEEALVWCQQCKHGGHFGHIDEWFQSHTKCPMSGCVCECLQNEY